MPKQSSVFCIVAIVLISISLNSKPTEAVAVDNLVLRQHDEASDLDLEMQGAYDTLPVAYQRVKRGSCTLNLQISSTCRSTKVAKQQSDPASQVAHDVILMSQNTSFWYQ